MTTIAERLQAVQTRIVTAAKKAGRNPDEITLVAVSKAHAASALREAYLAGQRIFGENYLQEALQKQADLKDLSIHWHFIGPIQSNKTQQIALNFDWVHSVDRLKIAERLHAARPESMPPLNMCIQVNVSGEASKSGIHPTEVEKLANEIKGLSKLRLRGLMAIPEPTDSIDLQRKQFRMLSEIQKRLLNQGYALDTLSMGMSHDYEIAIAEGATMIRVGTAIFGNRNYTA